MDTRIHDNGTRPPAEKPCEGDIGGLADDMDHPALLCPERG